MAEQIRVARIADLVSLDYPYLEGVLLELHGNGAQGSRMSFDRRRTSWRARCARPATG